MSPAAKLQIVLVLAASSALSGCMGTTQPRGDEGPTTAERVDELEARLEQLERRTNSAQMLEMMQRVETMHAELRELRGATEQRGHELESLNRRQRELYLDLDRRLQALETGGRTRDAAPSGEPAHELPRQLEDSPDDAMRDRYESAFRLLQEGRYPAALEAFTAYLDDYPDGQYSDNAQYWLGEVYYVTREYESALEEFGKVLDAFPESQKIPDAMLKIGYVHYELEQWERAREMLTRVTEQAPGTTVARLAEQRLQRMRQEGR